jgi:hypothetical protein
MRLKPHLHARTLLDEVMIKAPAHPLGEGTLSGNLLNHLR